MVVLSYLGDFFLFLLSIYFLFYLPGRILLGILTQKLSFFEEVVFSISGGIGVFLLGVFCISFLHLSFLAYLLVGVVFIYAAYKHYLLPSHFSLPPLKTMILFFVLTSIFSIPMLTSGVFGDNLYLKGVNSGDGLWHLSLIHELQHHFPPDIPGYAGVKLTGYHFFYNLLLAQVSNLTRLPAMFLLFQGFPVLTAFLLAGNIYIFLTHWVKKQSTGLLGIFLAFFGGSTAFIFPLFHLPTISLITGFGVDQPASTLMNPPYALSLIFLIFSLNCVYFYEQSKQMRWLLAAAISGGVTTMTKVYAGIILLGAWGVYSGASLLKKQYVPFLATLGIIFLTAITYFPFSDPSNHLLFSPLWMLGKMYGENMPWYGYGEKISTYSRLGVIKGLIITYLQGTILFILGNLGTRLIGILLLIPLLFQKKRDRFFSPPVVFLSNMLAISVILPTLFLQTGQVYEMIQFYWYSLFFFAMFAAYGIGVQIHYIKNNYFRYAFFFILFIATIPSAMVFLLPFFGSTGKYDSDTFHATQVLSRTGIYQELMLELPSSDTKNISGWYASQPMLSALADHASYLSFVNHTFAGTDVDQRLEEIETIRIFMKSGKDKEKVKSILKKFSITYMVSKERNPNLYHISKKELFHNNTITIYQVR